MTHTPDWHARKPEDDHVPPINWQTPVRLPQSNWQPPPSPSHWQPVPAMPGVIPLRPLELGEILSGAFATIRTRPALMLGVAAIVVTIAELIDLVVSFPLREELNTVAKDPYPTASEAMSLAGLTLAVTGIGLLFTIVTRVFLSGFVTLVVGTAVLGQRPSFGRLWTRLRPRLLPLLGLTLIYPAVFVGAALLVVGFTFAVPPLGILLALGLIVVGVWLWIMFALTTPALVLENVGVQRAFGRSRLLVRGSWWRIFGIAVVAWLIAFVISFVIMFLLGLFGGVYSAMTASALTPPTTNYLLLTTIGTIVASTLTEPFLAAVTVLLYTDQRMRLEGLAADLARSAANRP